MISILTFSPACARRLAPSRRLEFQVDALDRVARPAGFTPARGQPAADSVPRPVGATRAQWRRRSSSTAEQARPMTGTARDGARPFPTPQGGDRGPRSQSVFACPRSGHVLDVLGQTGDAACQSIRRCDNSTLLRAVSTGPGGVGRSTARPEPERPGGLE